MKSMWDSQVHKFAVINESKSGKQFIQFINMLMNDTTFLLDESMDTLKKIHEVQEEMADKARWSQQTQVSAGARGGPSLPLNSLPLLVECFQVLLLLL